MDSKQAHKQATPLTDAVFRAVIELFHNLLKMKKRKPRCDEEEPVVGAQNEISTPCLSTRTRYATIRLDPWV
jgi:hypothetical protein